MMSWPSRLAALVGGMLLPGTVSWLACSVPPRAVDDPGITTCVEGCPPGDAGADSPAEASPVGPEGGADATPRNANCGESTACNPDPDDAVWSCRGALVQQTKAPQKNTPSGPIKPDPQISVDAGGGAGAPGKGSPSLARTLACQVVRQANEPKAECVRAGEAREGEACRGVYADDDGNRVADCAPGLACVRSLDGASDNGAGQCRPYCCLGEGLCAAGSWCTLRRLYENSSTADPLFVPICAPADNCPLLEKGVCPEGLACVLVADRTTSCFTPGQNTVGQSCPCAEGLVCARSTNTCRALCRLGVAAGAPGSCAQGVCVSGGDALPPGYGLCSSL